MLSILSSVQLLSANVAKKKVSYLHRKRREISRYTANETVYVHANNLGKLNSIIISHMHIVS